MNNADRKLRLIAAFEAIDRTATQTRRSLAFKTLLTIQDELRAIESLCEKTLEELDQWQP